MKPFIMLIVVLLTACQSDEGQTTSRMTTPERMDGFDPIGRFVSDTSPPDSAPPLNQDAGVTADGAPTPSPELALSFQPIEQDSAALRLTDLAFIKDAPGEFITVDKDGAVYHMRLEDGRARTLGQFTIDDTHTADDSGLISVAIDPDFAENSFFYLGVSVSRETNVIRRYRLDPADYAATYESEVLVIRVTGEGSRRPWHNVGSIGFTDEGYLWALFGDKVLDDQAQNPQSLLGKVLRIIPEHGPEGGYTVPQDNPFADGTGHPAVYAMGLRSPWKAAHSEGRWFISEIGLDTYEEINRLEGPGQNFGWPLHEGPCGDACGDTSPPWIHYGRGSSAPFVQDDVDATAARLRSAWVGVVYEPNRNDPYLGRWNDKVVFGDTFSGFVRASHIDSDGESTHVGHLWLATAMAQAPDGYVYATGLGTWPTDAPMRLSPIYRVELAP